MRKQPGYQLKERAHFDRLAAEQGEVWWGSATAAGRERLRRRAGMVANELASRPECRVLELGCGTGAFTTAILELMPGLRLTACDISPVSLDLVRQLQNDHPQVQFHEADATDLPYPASSFDSVVGNSILHHLPVESTLQQCFDVLVPGGLLWLSEPNMLNPQIALERNVRPIGKRLQNTEDETAFFRWPLARLLAATGFERIDVVPFDFMHPGVPEGTLRWVDAVGRLLEQTPIVREIAGSLAISAYRPGPLLAGLGPHGADATYTRV